MSRLLEIAAQVIAGLFVLLVAVVAWHALLDLALPLAAAAVIALGIILALRWLGTPRR